MAVEDFTTYSETDPNSHIAKTATRVTVTDLNSQETAFVYKDKGAAFFSDDFTHNITVEVTAFTADGRDYAWAITNDNTRDMKGIDDNNDSYLSIFLYGAAGAAPEIYLEECDSGAIYQDNFVAVVDTVYYLTIARDESVGANGTLYCYIYSDAARTVLVDTLTIALHTSKKDFRYIFGANTRNSGISGRTISAYCENLELFASISAPTITTQAMASVARNSATGNGNLTAIGGAPVTAHGHVWNKTGTPDLTDSSKDNGAKGSTGAFTTNLEFLAPATLYYVRSFATNSWGTSYGNQVQFSTSGSQPSEGRIAGGPVTFAQHYTLIDWDDDDDFTDAESDITADVLDVDVDGGKDRELARATAAFLTLEVKNKDHKYSVPNSSSVLNQGGRTLRSGHKVLVGMSFPYDEFVDADAVTLANHYPTVPYDPTDLWSEETGTWVIDTDQVKETDGAGEAVMETEEADAHIACKFKKGADNDGIIVFRFSNTINYFYVRSTATDIEIRKVQATVDTQLATATHAWAVGATKTLKVILHGDYIFVLVDRALYINTTSTFNETATKHGMGGASIHGDARYDRWGCSYQLFYGRIDNITPNTDPGIQTAYIECSDDFKQLARTTLKRRVYPETGFPEGTDEFISEILKNSVGNVAQEGYILDAGEIIVAAGNTKAWWDVKALETCHRVEAEENGFFYQDPDGLWRFENRTHRTSTPHDAAIKTWYSVRATNNMFFTGLKWHSGNEDVVNRAAVSVQRSEKTNTANYYEEVWRAREADVVDGGVASSDLGIVASGTKVIYFEATDFDTIAALQGPVSTVTENKLAGTITNGPFLVGEQITTDVSGSTAYVVEQGGGFIRVRNLSAAFNAGDTFTGATSGATLNGGATITTIGDYVANAQADGGGVDKTGSLTVTLAALDASDQFNWGKGGKLTLSNSDGGTIYVTRLRVLGDGYKLKEKISAYVEDTTSQGNYGERSYDVDAQLLVTYDEALALATDIEDKEDDSRAKIDVLLQNSTRETLTQILARRLSDRVTLNWSAFGVNEDFYINKVRHHIYNGGASVDCYVSLEEVA